MKARREREEGEYSSGEERDDDYPTPRNILFNEKRDPRETTWKEEVSAYRELTQSMTQQNQQIAKLAARQAGLKELPRFSGDVEEWPIFLNQYEQSAKTGQYTSAENVSRLEKCLSGDAREAVKTLLSIPSSANTIIDILRQRYGNPRQLMLRLSSRAKEAEKPKDDNPMSIIKFATIVRNITFALKTLDGGRYLFGSNILDELENKLTPMMKMLWAEVIHYKPDYTVVDLSNWLDKRAELALSIVPLEIKENTEKTEERRRKPLKSGNARSVFAANAKVGQCNNCEEEHYTTVCPKLKAMTPDERYEKINELRLCRCCFGRNHRWIKCFRRRECGINGCKENHHRLLHGHTDPKKKAQAMQTDNEGKSVQ
uniref:Uncharacterized protein n=1 Tax=Phlebotomus papatasi TaxID=29031 RepID=A0A1B0DMQ2_PHLPP